MVSHIMCSCVVVMHWEPLVLTATNPQANVGVYVIPVHPPLKYLPSVMSPLSCKDGYTGLHCDQCEDKYYRAGSSCVPCDCHTDGRRNLSCNLTTGKCTCKVTYSWLITFVSDVLLTGTCRGAEV